MANSSLDLSDRAVLGPLAGLLSAVRQAVGETPLLRRDRRYTAPGKDASDIWLLLRHYAEAGNEERLYGEEGEAGLVAFRFNLETAGAWLLGEDAREILTHGPDPAKSLASLDAILRPEIDPDGALRLVAQMPPGDRDRQLSHLAAFCSGLFDTMLPRG